MAKIRLGGMAVQASGSMGGIVYSRNRYGAYIRARSVPVKSMTEFALAAKARLAAVSQAFQSLTTAEKTAWGEWALTNPRVDVFGEKQPLTAAAAFIGLNNRIAYLGGTQIDVPPLVAAPPALVTLSLTADIGAGDFELAYTATPLGAGKKLWIKAAVVDSVGINYVQNLLKLVGVSAAAQASPFDCQAMIEARFGTLQVGQKVVCEVSVVDPASGLLSQALRAEALVTST